MWTARRLTLPAERLSLYDSIRREGDVLPSRQESPVKPAPLQPSIPFRHTYVREYPLAPTNLADENIQPLSGALDFPHLPTKPRRKPHPPHICCADAQKLTHRPQQTPSRTSRSLHSQSSGIFIKARCAAKPRLWRSPRVASASFVPRLAAKP